MQTQATPINYFLSSDNSDSSMVSESRYSHNLKNFWYFLISSDNSDSSKQHRLSLLQKAVISTNDGTFLFMIKLTIQVK